VTTVAAPELSEEDTRRALERLDGNELTAEVLRVHADLVEQRARQQRVVDRFLHAHPGVPVASIPAQPADVHDLDGLRAIATALT
jgi:hypothetical protein